MVDKQNACYFVPSNSPSVFLRGSMGHPYQATKENPMKVTLEEDVELMRKSPYLKELDKEGEAVSEPPVEKTRPKSIVRTDPSTGLIAKNTGDKKAGDRKSKAPKKAKKSKSGKK